MKPYKILLLAFIVLSWSKSANAQLVLNKSVIANGGASYSSPGLSADWTVGQTVINQYTSSGLTITEGFHPLAVDAATPPVNGIAAVKNIVSVNAYPNPTSNTLNITVVQNQPGAITIQILDGTGRIVKSSITLPARQSVNTEIDMSTLSPGIYMFMINAHTKDAYIMKVVKQ